MTSSLNSPTIDHENRKNGKPTGRDASGRFTTGNPGRPPGARHKATRAALALLDGEAEALSRKAVELALGGDATALQLCLERIAPPRKDGPVNFALPLISSAANAAEAMGSVVSAVADGELTPAEGTAVAGLVETYRKTLETADLESRIAALEATNEKPR